MSESTLEVWRAQAKQMKLEQRKALQKTKFRPRCKECGCKIRGKNHEEGKAHKSRAKAR